jgi:hypothetical protein
MQWKARLHTRSRASDGRLREARARKSHPRDFRHALVDHLPARLDVGPFPFHARSFADETPNMAVQIASRNRTKSNPENKVGTKIETAAQIYWRVRRLGRCSTNLVVEIVSRLPRIWVNQHILVFVRSNPLASN